MSESNPATTLNKPFATDRRDAWWLGPLATAVGLGCAGLYLTWAAFQGVNYEWGSYLSPLYSPLFRIEGFPLSPAFLILWAPGGFRATCYYYRKAYYRSFFQHPTACAVTEVHGKGYKGERGFPFVIQNVHRYFMYIAVIFIGILWYDVIQACRWDDGAGGKVFGMGLGTLIMAVNATLLGGYTMGCHSLRHLVGGKVDCFSCTSFGPVRHKGWLGVSALNRHHQLYAWCSLFTVAFTDFYIRMCAMGVFHDIRFF